MRRVVIGTLAVLAVVLGTAPAAMAAPPTPTDNPGVTVWQHGGSNLGECSAYLATVLGVRGDVNHLIKNFLGVSPGSIYSDRARQAINLDPAAECLRHSF